MRKQDVVKLVFCVFCAVTAAAQSRPADGNKQAVSQQVFASKALGRDMRYSIILPQGYSEGNRRYPVLYLLHGLYGNHQDWISRTELTRYAEPLPIIIVLPDAGDSWYTDSASSLQDRYETYIVRDLIAEIDAKYRSIRARQGRAVAGLSMGGYAAIKFALKYPDVFEVAGSLSGALNAPLDLDRTEEYRTQLIKVFGPPASRTRTDNDVLRLAKDAKVDSLPYLFLSCGAADQFLNINREFAALIQSRKIAYEYHELPGRHSWKYWDGHIRDLLDVVAARMLPITNGLVNHE